MELRLGGIIDLSTVDYPGKLASVIFFHGCNFSCPFCYNPELVKGDRFKAMDIQSAVDILLNNRELIDGIVITGGEPTLQPNALEEFCKKIKSQGLKIKLDTNGSRPDVIEHLIKNKLVDFIAMDVKGSLQTYPSISGVPSICDAISRSIGFIKQSGIDYEFRTTLVPRLHNEGSLLSICALLKGSKKYVLQNFRSEKTLSPEYVGTVSFTQDQLESYVNLCAPFVGSCELRNF